MSAARWIISAVWALTCVAGFAGVKTFGKPLGLPRETRLSEILAAPAKFNGKKVRLRGLVTWVCPERGCTLKLGASKREIAVRFPNGAVSLPEGLKGSFATVEGVFKAQRLKLESCDARRRPHPCRLEGVEYFLDATDGGVEAEN